jgi:hypothetical protein
MPPCFDRALIRMSRCCTARKIDWFFAGTSGLGGARYSAVGTDGSAISIDMLLLGIP